jgi:glycosyltransferase involved in cell wall biosynthesis
MENKLSVIILTKNEEKTIQGCIKSVDWADEIILIDSGSLDKTVVLGKDSGAKAYEHLFKNFADAREFGKQKAKHNWILYLDADERITSALKKEIQVIMNSESLFGSFKIPRLNVFFGKALKHGGWYPDYQHRFFKKEALLSWQGIVHESPVVKGEVGVLVNYYIHFSHRSITDGFTKSVTWTAMEASLLYNANHPKIGVMNLFKVMVEEFLDRIIFKLGFLDGSVGLLEGFIQAANKFLVYAQLWEKQQNSSR